MKRETYYFVTKSVQIGFFKANLSVINHIIKNVM